MQDKICFRSQLEYGKYGAKICTPICCVVASKFITSHGTPIFSYFTQELMDSIMTTCHAMYKDCFAWKGENMMLKDIQDHFPSYIEYREIAGLTKNCKSENIEKLIIKSLLDLIEECRYQQYWSIIATYLDHTICYLFDGSGNIYYFNSLPASLINVTNDISQTLPTIDVEYSGLIIKCKN